jgi:hypothetical protein
MRKMKTRLKQTTLLFGLMTCTSACLALPVSADSTADLILSLKCQGDYTVNIWRRYQSGELLYRGTGLLGNLDLGRGTSDNTEAVEVYKFRKGVYTYQVRGGKADHQGQGTLEVFKNGRSILVESCTKEG